jgi:hypothetical protein
MHGPGSADLISSAEAGSDKVVNAKRAAAHIARAAQAGARMINPLTGQIRAKAKHRFMSVSEQG